VRELEDSQLREIIEQAYKEKGTEDLPEKELLEWLYRNGLTSEEAAKAINTAVKQRKIRFCYLSSVGIEKHVRCYERLTKEDLELDQELRRATISRAPVKKSKTRKTTLAKSS
jgi:hypothetical protein